jgi:hypothetical protein
MKYVALSCLLLATIATPSYAHEGNDCADKAAKIANHDERETYTKSCLDKVASHENSEKLGQKEKEANCDQNAKNMKLDGKKKSEYLQHCYKENDFDSKAPPNPKM